MTTRPVGLTRDLPPKRVMHAEVDGHDIVVWRAGNGAIAAWNNRCPHRGMALSHGFVRGNRLACLYHGWHFEPSGRCSLIPAHPDLDPPATIHAEHHGVLEAQGVIWVCPGGQAMAPALEPALAPLRSFIAEAPEQVVLGAAASTSFEGKEPDETGPGRVTLGGHKLALLCNPLGESRTQVTVLAGPEPGPAEARRLSRWCETLRRRAETAMEVPA